MSHPYPFLFLGHGEGSRAAYEVCVVARERGAELELGPALDEWGARHGLGVVRQSGPGVVVFRTTGRATPRAEGSAVALERLLLASHASTPLALVVRTNRVTPSEWHRWSLLQVRELFALVERHADEAGPYNEPPLRAGRPSGRAEGVHRVLLDDVRASHPAGAWLLMSFHVFRRSSAAAAKAVWADLVQERVPPLLGRRFGLDLVLVDELARALDIGHGSLETSPQFKRALAEAYATRNLPVAPEAHDWSSPSAVAAMLAGKPTAADWERLESALDETDAAHQRTVLELSHEQRLLLLPHGHLSTRLGNVANYFVMRGEYREALTIYDSVLEAPQLHPLVCTSPLYAACLENNKLERNDARARRYLAACLPYGDQNPLVYLNGSQLAAELGDADRCLELLARAKARGVKVRDYRNDRAYDLVRQSPEFKRLMGARSRR